MKITKAAAWDVRESTSILQTIINFLYIKIENKESREEKHYLGWKKIIRLTHGELEKGTLAV